MSRGQEAQAFSTSQGQEATDQGEAGSSFNAANSAISNYNENLSKFMSANPYTKGGEYDSTIIPGLTSTADAGATSVKGALQSQASRTGENAAGSAATAAEGTRQANRDLSSQEAGAEQTRMQDEATYNQQGVQDSSIPITANSQLYGTATSGANSAEGNATGASKTPGFWDTLGDSFATAFGKTLGGGNSGGGGGAAAGAGG